MTMTKTLKKLYDNKDPNSWAAQLRKKRFALFENFITSVPGPLKILDVGGTEDFWRQTAFFKQKGRDLKVTLININPTRVKIDHPNFQGMVGDARDLSQFKDREFDVVFSNSVIEHVGNYNDQLRMANEVVRVGKRYFVQTPNLYFPIEPHFVFPMFQFLPLRVKVWLINNFDLGWTKKVTDKQRARQAATSIRLLTKKEMIALFPKAHLFEEKLFGLTKSFVVYGGDGCNTVNVD